MAAQILEQLFDSPIKVKLLKLFLRNSDKWFQLKEAAQRMRSDLRLVKKQVVGLTEIGFLKSKNVRKRSLKSKKDDVLRVGVYYTINPYFEFFQELSNLVLKSSPASKEKILNNLKKLGRIKLALIAGVFLNIGNSRTDLLIVGEVNHKKLEKFLGNLESEVGKDIRYSLMNVKEFNYRYGMFDRFIHDILEKPHEKLINRLKL